MHWQNLLFVAAILRGCGRQLLGTCVALTSYYLVGIPASVVMGLVWRWGAWVSAVIRTNTRARVGKRGPEESFVLV